MKQQIQNVCRFFKRENREKAAEKYKKMNNILAALFPVFLVFLAELNQLQSFRELFDFILYRSGVFLFDIFMIGAIFLAVLALVKQTWIAATGVGAVFFILSCVEFFKFDVSGSHLIPQDLALAGKLTAVAGMAQLRLTPILAVSAVLLIAYILVLFCMGARMRMRFRFRSLISLACIAAIAVTLATPISSTILAAFDVDDRSSVNTFTANAKFDNNNLLAFWASELSLMLSKHIEEPESYDAEAVAKLLETDFKAPGQQGGRPNVVIVMNESYADFRMLGEGVADNACYEAFDAICADGLSGFAVVPTFGGYTGRSEFELLTGLPVASINDPIVPHSVIERDTVEGIPALFAARGYKTVYMHPYQSDFYDRSNVYPIFGFDRLLFEDDLDIGDRLFHNRAEDSLCFERALSILREEQQPVFLFVTTMQNHQPYYYEAENGVDELAYYLQGVAHTDEALADFRSGLDGLGENTIVLYVGDHFPFFGLDGNLYEQLNINETNCADLYRQRYFLYANYELDPSAHIEGDVSLFYLPHLLLALSNPETLPAVSAAFLAHAAAEPIYTTPYTQDASLTDPLLDTLTYDRLIGRAFSAGQ